MKNSVKYSIIIPARNGVKYLPACVNTIIDQKYADYELIISDDHSDDGSKDYLASLNHPNVRVFEPPKSLSMAEHWEWALSQASGEWLIFVGQDDGLQSYFFELANILTDTANRIGLRTIMSQRAYFFWKGCEFIYGDTAVRYNALPLMKILDSRIECAKVFFGIQSYFELPEMYTTSLFNRSILDEAKEKQNGKVFTAHPQDANLAAIACSLDKKFLKSFIPLGWVGSSPKSAGMAISADGMNNANEDDRQILVSVKKEYEDKINKSTLQYHPFAGNFALGSTIIYLWQAFLQTSVLRPKYVNQVLTSTPFKIALFSCAKIELSKSGALSADQQSMMIETLHTNHCHPRLIEAISWAIRLLLFSRYLIILPLKLIRKCYRMLSGTHITLNIKWTDNPGVSMTAASQITKAAIAKFGNFDRLQNLANPTFHSNRQATSPAHRHNAGD